VADTTLEGNKKLVVGLKDINDTAKELKKEELALEMKIHQENLRYNQEKDKMLLENAKLTLLNQSAVVAAMTSLADAIRIVRAPTVCTGTILADPTTTTTIAAQSAPARTSDE
jgi:hypothetical protein